MKEAELAARSELQAIVHHYREIGFTEAVGSSGTAKAICDLIEARGLARGEITAEGLAALREELIREGSAQALESPALRPDRVPVLPGGLAIMSAVFQEFELERMTFSEGALRLGVLYDLVGRQHHHDLREVTVKHFMRRYQVDHKQAERVGDTACALLMQLRPEAEDPDDSERRVLAWAAALHEIGISVAHASYHKHSAYILANADMPGFSRMDQARLARLVLGHRGKLLRLQAFMPDEEDWLLIFCLRMAALLHRARDDAPMPAIKVQENREGYAIRLDAEWLASAPLTAAVFEEDKTHWAALGRSLRVIRSRALSAERGLVDD
jgi:exopolyphosphatase/guanosine-5'-triphosphate,3'-diphosphate pyrophosphatase